MSKKKYYSIKDSENRTAFRDGMRNGIPIGLGYLAVGFSLGIAAKNAGLTPGQNFLVSILCNASAGQYAGLTVIAIAGSYLAIALMTFIANARYMLMSCALSQRLDPGTAWWHRMLIAMGITDEIFAVTVSRPGFINPWCTYGALLIASPMWATGNAIGCFAGNIMPVRLVSALSVALFGMFLAVIIPPARKSRIIAALIVVSFAASYACAHLPVISSVSGGTRTIILTVAISTAAAILFPHAEASDSEQCGENADLEDALEGGVLEVAENEQ
ncbi:MAG: AzlC family ABC transporter permease [Eubacteriaceae bacterium]|nr:AzlC family ABC transporter permease [Eubacteriaceae bacterium]